MLLNRFWLFFLVLFALLVLFNRLGLFRETTQALGQILVTGQPKKQNQELNYLSQQMNYDINNLYNIHSQKLC